MRGVNAGTPLPKELKNVYLSNVTTLTTKVRVDLLRGIADRIRGDQEHRNRHVFVSAFVSSPQLHINPSSVKGPGDSFRGSNFSFSDAIEQFGSRLTIEDKFWAYRRVNRGFRGQLESLFVCLTEREREKSLCSEAPPRRQDRVNRAGPSSGRGGNRSGSVYSRGNPRPGTPVPGEGHLSGANRPKDSQATPSKRKRTPERRRSGEGKKRRDSSSSSSSSSASESEEAMSSGDTSEPSKSRKKKKSKKSKGSRRDSGGKGSSGKGSSGKGSTGKRSHEKDRA
jgi:hypothetical protein